MNLLENSKWEEEEWGKAMAKAGREPQKKVDHSDIDLLNSPDPYFWAVSFVQIRNARLAKDGVDIAEDVGTMVGWFANAFQRGEWNSAHYKGWADAMLADLDRKTEDERA